MLKFIIVFAVLWVIGLFGWAQIIGSLQNVSTRGIGLTLFTTVVWTCIMAAGAVIVVRYFSDCRWAMLAGYGISFLNIITKGKIE